MRILCPFHVESNPSCAIYRNKYGQIRFYCFACNAAGNIEDLAEELSEQEEGQLHTIGQLFNLQRQLEKYTDIVQFRESKEDTDSAALFYQSLPRNIWQYEDIIGYLRERGYTDKSIELAGIRVNSVNCNPLVIPLYHLGEDFCGYLCRRIDDSKEDKYRNNTGLRKTKYLPGYKREDSSQVLIVEGMLDALRALQHGEKEVYALLGCHPSKEQIRILKSLQEKGKKIIWATDNDKPGIAAYNEAIAAGIECKRFVFPEGVKDIGDITHKYVYEHYRRETLYNDKAYK